MTKKSNKLLDFSRYLGDTIALLWTKRADENPTIGILICKSKDNVLAQYALESSNQPIAISQYDLERLYPEKVEGVIPSIEDIEASISHNLT